MGSSTWTKSTTMLLAFATLVAHVNAAVIPHPPSTAENDLNTLKIQPSLGSEDSLEQALQGPQVAPDSPEETLLDVVGNDKNVETAGDLEKELPDDDDDDGGDGDKGDNDDGDDDDDGDVDVDGVEGDNDVDDDDDDEGEDDVDEDPEEQLEDLRPGDIQVQEIQAGRDYPDSAREYEKALQAMRNENQLRPESQDQTIENEGGRSSKENLPHGEEEEEDYEGYGTDNEGDEEDEKDEDEDDNEDDYIEITDASKPVENLPAVISDKPTFVGYAEAQIPPTNAYVTPPIPEPLSEEVNVEPHEPPRSLDDVIVSEDDDVMHDDVKRGDKVVGMPGRPPLRVIELNETLYLNHTDESQPKFRPVRIPDKFEDYDVNRDGLISLLEMRYVTGAVEGAGEAFQDADRDGDGWVERAEFDLAGWGLPVNPTPTPTRPPQRRVVFVPREDLHPSSIPRGTEDVSSRRGYGRRRH